MTEKTTQHGSIGGPPEAIVKALRTLLRPLVKMLLSFQVTYPFLSELLKSIYVDVAENDFKLEGKKQTDTRISMLTGVHRKDTKRLRGQAKEEVYTPSSVSIGAQILAVWVSNEKYLDGAGNPASLPFKSSEQSSFEGLVTDVAKQDIRARVVLDEWLNIGIVQIDDQENITLLKEAFIADSGLEEKAFYLGMNIADHISAVDHNLQGADAPLFERCVYYDGLSKDSIDTLNAAVQREGMALLKSLNKRALALREKDSEQIEDTDQTHTFRMNTGVYYFYEADESALDPNNSPVALDKD